MFRELRLRRAYRRYQRQVNYGLTYTPKARAALATIRRLERA